MGKKIMIRIFSLFLVLSLFGCTGYGDETVIENGITFEISNSGRKAYVSSVRTDLENTEIVIPEKVNKASVVRLGGFFGTGVPDPFVITADPEMRVYAIDEPEYMGDPVLYEEKIFHIFLPKTMEKIALIDRNPMITLRNEYGTNTVYYPRYFFTVDEENRYLYAEDGKLYNIKDDTPAYDEEKISYPAGDVGYAFEELSFEEKVCGRYETEVNGDKVLVEVFVGNGVLYMNIGYYIDESLYSYSAVEISFDDPAVLKENTDQQSAYLRQYSLFSNGGDYWGGAAEYTLKVTEYSLQISEWNKEGEELFGREDILLERKPDTESQFPVRIEETDDLLQEGDYEYYPYRGHMYCNGWIENEDYDVRFYCDNVMVFIDKRSEPHAVYKGMFRFLNRSRDIAFCLSRLGEGERPYRGRITVDEDGNWIIPEELMSE